MPDASTTQPLSRVERAAEAFERAVRDAPSVDLSWIGRPLREDGWELAPDVLRLLWSLVHSLQPRHVVEFGSGLSTLVLARAAAPTGCVVSSVDHDPTFARATAERLSPEDAEVVTLQTAPIVARTRAGRLHPTYLVDAARLGSSRAADLILIDGPPEVLGGRLGVFYQALDHAQAGTIILLDDAERDGERQALAESEAVLGDAVTIRHPEGFARGLAAVTLIAPTVAGIRMGQA